MERNPDFLEKILLSQYPRWSSAFDYLIWFQTYFTAMRRDKFQNTVKQLIFMWSYFCEATFWDIFTEFYFHHLRYLASFIRNYWQRPYLRFFMFLQISSVLKVTKRRKRSQSQTCTLPHTSHVQVRPIRVVQCGQWETDKHHCCTHKGCRDDAKNRYMLIMKNYGKHHCHINKGRRDDAKNRNM